MKPIVETNWAKEFKKILVEKYNISKTDAIFIANDVEYCINKYKT